VDGGRSMGTLRRAVIIGRLAFGWQCKAEKKVKHRTTWNTCRLHPRPLMRLLPCRPPTQIAYSFRASGCIVTRATCGGPATGSITAGLGLDPCPLCLDAGWL